MSGVEPVNDEIRTLMAQLAEVDAHIEEHEAMESAEPCLVRLADGSLMDVYELHRRITAELALAAHDEYHRQTGGECCRGSG